MFFLICFCCGLSVLHFICLVLCYKIVNLVLRLGVVDIVSISLFIALVSRIYALIVFYSKIDFLIQQLLTVQFVLIGFYSNIDLLIQLLTVQLG